MNAAIKQDATAATAPEPVTTIKADRLAALLKIAPKSNIRYYPLGIYFDPAGYAVATDGRMMLAARVPAFSGDGFIIPRAVAEMVSKQTPPRDRSFAAHPVFRDRFGAMLYTPVAGRFPDWRRVMPTNPSGERAHYDPDLVATLRDAVEICGGEKFGVIAENGDGPGVMRTPDDIAAIIMPMRADAYQAPDAGAAIAAFLRPVDG